jgi:hypothetical protein
VFRGHEPGQTANRSVSAADVVLYGVNLILPLMSQDLLKVIKEGECEHENYILSKFKDTLDNNIPLTKLRS